MRIMLATSLAMAALLWGVGCKFHHAAPTASGAPAPVEAVDAQATAQDERDEIFSLLAYAVVLADWQTTNSKPKRGHNIGAVLVDDQGQIVSWARNCNAITGNGTQHGEVRLMIGYLDKVRSYDLKGHTVYTSLEPCAQCSGMMIQQSVKRTVYGQTDPDFGKAMERLQYNSLPDGYGPYPRPVISELSRSPIAAELDRAYKANGSNGLTAWLLTDEAKGIYAKALDRLLNYPLRYKDNAPTLQAAQRYLATVPENYTPIALGSIEQPPAEALATAALDTSSLIVRVLDVGPGLACIIGIPASDGRHYVVYDAGHWNADDFVVDEARKTLGAQKGIDLMVLSHSDSDHLGAVDELCDVYDVRRIIHSGFERDTDTWRDANAAILQEEEQGCDNIDLSRVNLPPGTTYQIGDAAVTVVCGFSKPPGGFGTHDVSEYRNAGSIVIRVVFGGRSVLLCGDAVGRHLGDADDACIATEAYMLASADNIPIDSDVIVAPHHGADNGSSTAFVQRVSPEYVIFSAGHQYQHPTQAAANRYLNAGVQIENMFRTDRGDDESASGPYEWDHDRQDGWRDRAKDDNVAIVITASGEIQVFYE